MLDGGGGGRHWLHVLVTINDFAVLVDHKLYYVFIRLLLNHHDFIAILIHCFVVVIIRLDFVVVGESVVELVVVLVLVVEGGEGDRVE